MNIFIHQYMIEKREKYHTVCYSGLVWKIVDAFNGDVLLGRLLSGLGKYAEHSGTRD